MHTPKTTIITLAGLCLSACSYTKNMDASGETEGESKPNWAPEEVEDPPQWHCRARAPNVQIVSEETSQNLHQNPKQAEVCTFGLSTDPRDPFPPKPHWVGLPDMVSDYLADWAQHDLAELDDPHEQAQMHHPMYVLDDPNHQNSTLTAGGDLRSGLIGNFAIWVRPDGVPNAGLRPPIVTASFFDIIGAIVGDQPTFSGNPFTSGRYNAWGMPCNTTDPINSFAAVNVRTSGRPDAAECAAFVAWDDVRPNHRLYPYMSGEEHARGEAYEQTACLDNGGEYHPLLAFPSAITDRGGLLWINWDELSALRELVHSVVLVESGLEWVAEQLLVFLDLAEQLGYDFTYWKEDPPWPYNRFSFTGVCAHPAQLRATLSGDVRTTVPCPTSYAPVFPDFDLPVVDDDWEIVYSDWQVDGYCTLPFAAPPSDGAAGPTPVPEILYGLPGHGFDGAIYLSRPTQETLAEWADGVTARRTSTGIELLANNATGQQLLRALRVPHGSRIVGEKLDALSLFLDVDSRLARGEVVTLLLNTPEGRRLHRYIVPVDLPSNDDGEVTAD